MSLIRTMSTMRKFFLTLAMFAIAVGGLTFSNSVSASDPTVTYTGQGFNFDGTTYNINDERCGLTGQNDANDGGTGQFANWNGLGMPYQQGQGYIVWVLTLNTGKNAQNVTLHLPDGEVSMFKIGGTYKYASQYYNYEDIFDIVHATFTGNTKNVQLVVSHGCQPFDGDVGAWCSPGYWRNASDAAWALTGHEKSDLFNEVVVHDFYDTAFISDDFPDGPTLIQVLTTPGANTFGGVSGPYVPGLNAFNATGAALTDALEGFMFDPSRIGEQNACPIDNHGNPK